LWISSRNFSPVRLLTGSRPALDRLGTGRSDVDPVSAGDHFLHPLRELGRESTEPIVVEDAALGILAAPGDRLRLAQSECESVRRQPGDVTDDAHLLKQRRLTRAGRSSTGDGRSGSSWSRRSSEVGR
jgi:hypothetical protein